MTSSVEASPHGDGVAVVSLDSGGRNFLTWELSERLEETLVRLREDATRVVVIASRVEGYFLAHGDLDDILETFGGGAPSGDPTALLRVQRELDTGPMVSIAAVDGQAWGGGAELAWACDLRVASTRASFAQPEVLVGTTPAGGAARIARLAGEAAACRLVLDGRPVAADEALRLGLVHRVVPAGEALASALEWAEWLAARPPWALAECKRALLGGRAAPFRDALRAETEAFVRQLAKPEVRDRVTGVRDRYRDGGDSWDAFGIPRAGALTGAA